MRTVVQRVAEASVDVDGQRVSSIGPGILLLAAFRKGDSNEELDWTARKCLELRIFEDGEGRMNRSLLDVEGDVLVVSQFTLYGDVRRGKRPSYTESAPAEEARRLYRQFVDMLGAHWPRVAEGVFQARMRVSLVNDGPVTLIVERDAHA
ncbi:MAG: D-tyrosyl-tRNA(Tyr) deacylase [Candidatus Krumholzibacteriota bacterium]|nr:D-tyrosyl-tRNA(Tyr) deacylase [Candidatus Krumholzibacteriota bacterium]